MKKNSFGFTLIEVLVVCIVLAILATFAITSYQRSVQDSRNDKAKETLRKVANAYSMFDYEYPGRCINPGVIVKSSGTCEIQLNNSKDTLLNCKYMENEDWDDDPYQYEICGGLCGASGTCSSAPTCCSTARYACAHVKTDSASQAKAGSRYTGEYAIVLNKDGTLEEGSYYVNGSVCVL